MKAIGSFVRKTLTADFIRVELLIFGFGVTLVFLVGNLFLTRPSQFLLVSSLVSDMWIAYVAGMSLAAGMATGYTHQSTAHRLGTLVFGFGVTCIAIFVWSIDFVVYAETSVASLAIQLASIGVNPAVWVVILTCSIYALHPAWLKGKDSA